MGMQRPPYDFLERVVLSNLRRLFGFDEFMDRLHARLVL